MPSVHSFRKKSRARVSQGTAMLEGSKHVVEQTMCGELDPETDILRGKMWM